jgi:uncharacterized protein (TIGR02284 family)
MKNQKEMIEELKGLVNILNDGKVGYKDAIDNVKSEQLKSHFLEFSNQRQEMALELKNMIINLGGESTNDDGGILGAMHRVWMEVKEVFSSNDDEAILNAIETGEKTAIEKYEATIKDLENQFELNQVLESQLTSVRSALQSIKSLKLMYQD